MKRWNSIRETWTGPVQTGFFVAPLSVLGTALLIRIVLDLYGKAAADIY